MMKPLQILTRMERRKLVLGGAAAALLAVAVAFAIARTRQQATPRAPAEMPGTAGMQGMAGMDIGGGSIHLTADEIRTFGITFGTAEVLPLKKTIRTVGLVEVAETRLARVAPKFGGWVERVYVDFTGKPARKGEPLLEVYSPELVTAEEELLLAKGLKESVGQSSVEGVSAGAADLLESAMRRLRYWDISVSQIDEILRTGEVRRTLTLHAPVSGIVVEKNIVEGQAFMAGQTLYTIADLSEVWVNADVFETDVSLVHEGMPAEVTFAALPARVFRGRVEYVYRTLDEKTRSVDVRVAVPNPTGEIKPGMYATVKLVANLGEALTVPSSAILYAGERALAFVDMGGGMLMPHELTLGHQGEDNVQVLDGLEPGMRVVTSAQFLLDSESNLAEVMRAMMAQMNLSDVGRTDMPGMKMEMPGMPGMDTTGGRKEQ